MAIERGAKGCTCGRSCPGGGPSRSTAACSRLTDADLAGRTLGCGDGPASFNAEATAAGHAVVSCDPVYALTAGDIRRRVEETFEVVVSQVKLHPERFVWGFHRDPDDLARHRLAAMGRVPERLRTGQGSGRYVAASLPRLPFADGEFRLALVSHLLFLYSEHLDESAHVASVTELLRVAGEVRIFPLVTLEHRPSPHVGPVRSTLEAAGYRSKSWTPRMSSSVPRIMPGAG